MHQVLKSHIFFNVILQDESRQLGEVVPKQVDVLPVSAFFRDIAQNLLRMISRLHSSQTRSSPVKNGCICCVRDITRE